MPRYVLQLALQEYQNASCWKPTPQGATYWRRVSFGPAARGHLLSGGLLAVDYRDPYAEHTLMKAWRCARLSGQLPARPNNRH